MTIGNGTNVGEIRARITLEMTEFRRQMDDARNRIRQLEGDSRRGADGMRDLGSALTGLGAGAGLAKLVHEMQNAVNEANKLFNAFQGLTAVAKGFGVQTDAAQKAAEDLADRGFLTLTQAVLAYKTALSTGLDLDESTKLINALADSAAYNRQSFYDMGGAVQASLDGIKNGNSVLSDAVGVTKNLSVMQKEYAASIGTTAGRLTDAQKIQAAYTGFLRETAIFAGNADEAMQGFTGSQNRFTQATNEATVALGEAFMPVVQSVLEALTPMIKGLANFTEENKALVAGLASGTAGMLAFVAALALVPPALSLVRAAIVALGASTGPIGIAIVAIGALVGGIAALVTSHKEAAKAAAEQAKKQEELNAVLNKAPIDRTQNDVDTLAAKTEELNPLLEERAKLQARLNELNAAQENGTWMPEMFAETMDINEAIGELDEKLEDLGYENVEQATQKLREMNEFVKAGTNAITDQDKAEASALATKKQTLKEMSALAREFKALNAAQDLDASQKNRLVDITEKLIAQYPELNAQQGEDGRIRASNIDTIIAQIDTDKRFTDAAAENVTTRIRNFARENEAQAKAVQAQIDNLQRLSNALAVVSGANAKTFSDDVAARTAEASRKASGKVGDIVFGGAVAQMATSGAQTEVDAMIAEELKKQQKYNDAARELEKLASEVESGAQSFTKDIIAPDAKKGAKEKAGKTAAELAAEARKAAYEADLKTVQFVSEFYNLTADKQIAKYEELKKKHATFLKESVDDARTLTLQLKSLAAESDQERYDASVEFINAEIRKMENAGKTEREIANQRTALWTQLRNKYGKNTEFYKAADENVYQSRKDLTEAAAKEEDALYKSRKALAEQYENDVDDMLDVELKAIKRAKDADIDAIEKRKKAALDDYDARIDAIQKLRDANKQANEDADYAAELSAKQSRLAQLQSAVGPAGIAEREALLAEIAQMQLEHDRELTDRSLEAQQQALADEKAAAEQAYDNELARAESQYDALTAALETHADDVKAIEAGIQAFRVTEAANANTQILADLDMFAAQYSAKMAAISELQKAVDLTSYNANKDAYDRAKATGNTAETARLAAENQAIRDRYGIPVDSGKKLQSFDVGGIIPGARGTAVPIIAHGSEIVLNDAQQAALWSMLTQPRTVPQSSAPVTQVVQNIDMGAENVTLTDRADVAMYYDEKARAVQRLQSAGVKTS